ncbi:MAG: hypothetical protein QW429_03370 [Thermoprotei archaeon]
MFDVGNEHSELVEALRNKEIRSILEKALEIEEQHNAEHYLGWTWYEIPATPQTLNKLVRLGLLKINFRSNRTTCYMVNNQEYVRGLLEGLHQEGEGDHEETQREEAELPDDLFGVIVGYDDKKELIRRALTALRPVHVLLVGDIASGKTVFLQELARLPDSVYVLGSRLSSAGIYEYMFESRPRYLILDELDKVGGQDNFSALLSLMETGILSEMKHNKKRRGEFKCWVFGGANHENKIPPEILSRFGAYKLRFRQYTPQEYVEVATKVLNMREGVTPDLAKYIAEQTLTRLQSRDVRMARSIARTAGTKEEVDRVIDLLVGQGGV